MGNIDELMATCPLKQYIRQNLWETFIKKLNRKPISYLTFYAPTIMDVKHFTKRGYIKFEESVYKNVVGITNDEPRGYPTAIGEGKGRLEVFKIGEAHKLISSSDKDLICKFPFDVINLDYCNYIFGPNNNPYISGNLKDISLIIEHQKKNKCREFILFITTRTDKRKKQEGKSVSFAKIFIDSLKSRIKSNIQVNPEFRKKYKVIFSGDIDQAEKLNYKDFINIGIVKLIAMELAANGYVIKDCSAMWLVRDEVSPQRDLLHIAIHVGQGAVKKVKSKELSQYGGVSYLEGGVTLILDKISNGKVESLTEKKDRDKLNKLLGSYIKQLREDTFEIKVPEPLPHGE